MKIEVNINKTGFFVLMFLVLGVGGVLVYVVAAPIDNSVFHGVDQIDWATSIQDSVDIQDNLKVGSNLSVGNNLTVKGNLSVVGSVDFGGIKMFHLIGNKVVCPGTNSNSFVLNWKPKTCSAGIGCTFPSGTCSTGSRWKSVEEPPSCTYQDNDAFTACAVTKNCVADDWDEVICLTT